MEIEQKEDIIYFVDKAISYCYNNDIENALVQLKKIKILEEADIVYTLAKKGKL